MRYVKKPVEVMAWDIASLLLHYDSHGIGALPHPVEKAWDEGILDFTSDHITIVTLEGCVIGRAGDMLIRGTHGEWYPCKIHIFVETFEQAI